MTNLAEQALQSQRYALGEFCVANEGDISGCQEAAALMVRQAFELLIEVCSTDADPEEIPYQCAAGLLLKLCTVSEAA